MASFRRQKEALRAAVFAFWAGVHHVTEEVERSQSLSPTGSTPEATEARHVMLEADYQRLIESPQAIEMLTDTLNEEELYPFGSEWPREAIWLISQKLIHPKLGLEVEEVELRFRFKKGFKELLNDLAGAIESHQRNENTLDHWLALLLNTAFYTGLTVAARSAENAKTYYEVISEIEGETEPWTRYSQLGDLLDRQLSRETKRRTGLVSDLDFEG